MTPNEKILARMAFREKINRSPILANASAAELKELALFGLRTKIMNRYAEATARGASPDEAEREAMKLIPRSQRPR